ncbi:hypothetical protein ACJJTC_012983 [Scirpophaga incertulas]
MYIMGIWRQYPFYIMFQIKMARPKNTKEEILARRRIAKRKRYAALKENKELYNIEKEKEKRRYLKRKAEKKIIGIKDLTPRIVKSQDEPSEHGGYDPLQSGSSNYIKETNRKDENETDKIFKLRAKIRHICYQRDKDIKTLKIKLCNVKKEHKKLKRLLNKYNEVLRDPKTTTSKKKKNVQARKTGYKRAQKHFNAIKEKEVVKKIEYFYNEDENTRVVPGIKEFITRKKNRQQKRYLNDTLKNLYKKFCIENQTISVSYSFFLYNEMCLDRKCSTCAHKVIEYLGYSNLLRKLTWNYMEVGHGKGAPDGLGAVVKRTANRIVNSGTDVGTFTKFVQVIRANVSNIKIFEIASANIDEKERMIPKFVPTFKGTMAVHQVIWRCGSESNRLEMRSRSCFICQENTCCRHYHLGIHDLEKALTSQTPIFEDTTSAMPVNISQPSCSYSSDIQVKLKRHPSKQRSNIYLKQEGQAKDITIFPAVHNLSALKKELERILQVLDSVSRYLP